MFFRLLNVSIKNYTLDHLWQEFMGVLLRNYSQSGDKEPSAQEMEQLLVKQPRAISIDRFSQRNSSSNFTALMSALDGSKHL